MTIDEALRILNISKQRLYLLLKQGKIELTNESIENYKNTRQTGRPKGSHYSKYYIEK